MRAIGSLAFQSVLFADLGARVADAHALRRGGFALRTPGIRPGPPGRGACGVTLGTVGTAVRPPTSAALDEGGDCGDGLRSGSVSRTWDAILSGQKGIDMVQFLADRILRDEYRRHRPSAATPTWVKAERKTIEDRAQEGAASARWELGEHHAGGALSGNGP